jgi:hypothetical protein
MIRCIFLASLNLQARQKKIKFQAFEELASRRFKKGCEY